MIERRTYRKSTAKGFTLLETMIAMALLMIIMGAIFQQIGQAQQRAATEQARLDLFQESREFMDQMSRDLRDSGYPNTRNFASDDLTLAPKQYDSQMAAGLVKANDYELWFEAMQPKPDGSGDLEVHSIQYSLDTISPGCPCLQRSETVKSNGSPVGQISVLRLEVQNVLNTTTGIPIFRYYRDADNGLPVTGLPVDLDSAPAIIGDISAIQVTVQVQSPYADIKTGQKPVMTLVSAIRLRNCSPTLSGTMGCSYNAY